MFAHKITGADTRFPTLKICPECGKGAVRSASAALVLAWSR